MPSNAKTLDNNTTGIVNSINATRTGASNTALVNVGSKYSAGT